MSALSLPRIVLAAVLVAAAGVARAEVRLNEVLAANRLAGPDADGDFTDWVEIVNTAPLGVSLAGFSLSDDPLIPRKWVFPDVVLPGGEHVVVRCSGKNRVDPAAELHSNFNLSRQGERLVLHRPDGALADTVAYPPQTEDHSWGRAPDGSGEWRYLLEPTPGGANDTLASDEPISSRPEFAPPAGEFAEPPLVTISAHVPDGVELRYTLDGSAPTATSPRHDRPIAPVGTVVVRAAGFLGERRVTQIATSTYLTGVAGFELPALSLAMAPDDFVFVHMSAQGRGREFEREGHLEIFDEDGTRVAAAGMGFRLHGGAGRSGPLTIKKSYRAYFRSEYGDARLEFPLFGDGVQRFDQIVLRANTADAYRTGRRATLIRDQVIRDLHRDMGALASRGTWYNLFVNGAYRGVYNVSERIDESFFAEHVPGTREEDWDVIAAFAGAIDGTIDEWRDTVRFFEESDLRDEALLEEALGRVDVENLTGYVILNIWAQNHDWPANNWFAARPRTGELPWVFLAWDAEAGLGWGPQGHRANSFEHFFVSLGRGADLPIIVESLFAATSYQQYFLEELDRHLDEVLAPDHVVGVVREHADRIAGDIPEEAAVTGGDAAAWPDSVAEVESFASERGPVIRQFILESPRFRLPRAIGFDPPAVAPVGELDLLLEGRDLTPQSRVLFNGIEARSEWLSPVSMTVTLPYDIRVGGEPEVTVADGDFSVRSRGLLGVVFPRPVIVNLQPAVGSEEGGDEVLVSGLDFLEGVQVFFGDEPAPFVERFFDTSVLLRVVTPPGVGTVAVRAVNTRPGELPGETTLPFTYVPPSPPPLFRRGDANSDGRVGITDAIVTLDVLFRGAQGGCADALDADDSGSLNITDAVVLLNYLFRAGGRPPPPPFDGCGLDPTPDRLRCRVPGMCE